MDLFDHMRENPWKRSRLLPPWLRPRTLDEIVGQQHIIEKISFYTGRSKRIRSARSFLWPSGNRKNDHCQGDCQYDKRSFYQINATSAGEKDMEQVIDEAKNNLGMYGQKTILFVDEIHRFNKGQQDYLLPFCGGRHDHPYWSNDRKPLF